jgi:hypothetical protein
LSGTGLCDELITRPEKSYRLWCVVACDLVTWGMRKPWPTGGCRAKNKNKKSVCESLLYFHTSTQCQLWSSSFNPVFCSGHYSDI